MGTFVQKNGRTLVLGFTTGLGGRADFEPIPNGGGGGGGATPPGKGGGGGTTEELDKDGVVMGDCNE